MENWQCYYLLGVNSRTSTKEIRMRINNLRTRFGYVEDSVNKSDQLETLRKIETYFERENLDHYNYQFENKEWKKNWVCFDVVETNRSKLQKASFFGRKLNINDLRKSPAKV